MKNENRMELAINLFYDRGTLPNIEKSPSRKKTVSPGSFYKIITRANWDLLLLLPNEVLHITTSFMFSLLSRV